MPADTITPAISAYWASTRRALSSISCNWAARAPRMRASARSWVPASARTRSPTPSSAWCRPISTCARRASASSTPIAASASCRSRTSPTGNSSMPLIKFGAHSRDKGGAHSHDKEGRFVEDPFFFVPDGKAYPDEKGVIVTLARFQGEKETLFAHHAPVGVRLASSENPAVLKPDLPRLAAVALEFPK